MKIPQNLLNRLSLLLILVVAEAIAGEPANAQESKVATPTEILNDTDLARRAKALATLTQFVKTEQFFSLEEIEELLDGEFTVELKHSSAIHYKLISKNKYWNANVVVNIGTASLTGKPWLRTVELVANNICIPEGTLSELWFREAGIPIEKSIFNRNLRMWTTRSIPHVVGTMLWSISPTDSRTVSYWLNNLNPQTCANGFSFSFSPKPQE